MEEVISVRDLPYNKQFIMSTCAKSHIPIKKVFLKLDFGFQVNYFLWW